MCSIIRGWKKLSAGYLGWGGFWGFWVGLCFSVVAALRVTYGTGKFPIALVGTKSGEV